MPCGIDIADDKAHGRFSAASAQCLYRHYLGAGLPADARRPLIAASGRYMRCDDTLGHACHGHAAMPA